jgi:uncharacterized cupredoxin-like copper-binding protein
MISMLRLPSLLAAVRATLFAAVAICSALFAAPSTAAAQPPSIYAFNVSGPGTINRGQSAILNWSVSHGATVSLSPNIGVVQGTWVEVSPIETTTYTLTATNAAGSVTRTRKITVIVPPVLEFFRATPETVEPGKASTLTWSAPGATSFTVVSDVGDAPGTQFGNRATVRPWTTTNYIITARNAAGTDTRTVEVRAQKSGVKPRIDSLTATPSSLLPGQSTTLVWSVTGAVSLSISPGVGTVSGNHVVLSPSAATTYTLTATSDAGSVTRNVTVNVTPPPPTIATFTAEPLSIFAGQTSSLQWSVSGADTLSLAPAIGVVTGTSTTVAPATTTTYVLTAANAGGTTSANVTVNVSEPPPVIQQFTAAPNPLVQGSTATLAWSVLGNATLSISADQGPSPGVVTGNSTTVTPASSTTYTLTATNSSGTVSRTVALAVVPPPPVIASFTVTPAPVTLGQPVTFAWSVANASTLTISPNVGAVTGSSVTFTPTASGLYTLTAGNAGGTSTATVSVVVDVPPPLPIIHAFTATPDTITGGSATLAWSVEHATQIVILANAGANPGDVTGLSNFSVSPGVTTTYTMTARNASGQVTATKTVTVNTPAPQTKIESFTASSYQVVPGTPVTLEWVVSHGGSLWLSADNGGDPGSMNGKTSTVVHPTVTTRYALSAYSTEYGTDAKSLIVNVGPLPAPTIESFTATPATIAPGASTTLAWSVNGATAVTIAANSGTSPGTVTGNSLTVSPAMSTVYTLTATNAAGTAVTQSVSVTVSEPGPVSIQITPSLVQLHTGATQVFNATVTGSTNQAVTWSVVEPGGGSITSAGLYTAPSSAGTFHVRAVAAADPAVSTQATLTVSPPVVTPPTHPSGDGTHFVQLMSPNAGQRFLAPGFLRVFVAAKDLNNWQNRHRAASVQIMVDDVVHATIPGDQSEYWVYKTNLSGIPAGAHRLWARAHFVDGKTFDSEVVSFVVEPPPAYAQVIDLPGDVVLTGATNYEFVGTPQARIRINGNGFTIRSGDNWTGRLTLKHVDLVNLGVLLAPTPGVKVTTTGAIQIEHCVFDSTNALDVTANGAATAVIRANEFRSNMYMNVAQFPINLTTGPDATDPVIRLQGNSTAAQVFQGNNVGLSTLEVRNARNWLIGGATSAEANVLIGPRVGLALVGGSGLQVRGNISEQRYFGGWSQGNNFELNSGSDLVVEHNLISGGSWPVRGTGGTFRYNLVLNAGEDWLWISQSNAQVHHNIFAEGANDRAGIFLIYGPHGVQFTNNTLDGFGVEPNQVPLLADDGSNSNIASNVFYRFRGTPIVGLKGSAVVNANHNLFHNPGVASIRNYQDNRHPAQDVGGLNAQIDPQFATPTPPSYSTIDRGAVWQRAITLDQLLATYRAYYTPAAGSPLIDAGDPAGGVGNDIGAIGAGAPNSADQFARRNAGAPPSVSVSILPATKTLTTGASASFTATVFGHTNQSVAWSVVEAGGGSITSAGLYTAPTTPGTFRVRAVAVADANASAQATVIVSAAGPATPTIGSFIATPGTIPAGSSATLSWSVTGADTVSIAPGIGAVTGTSVVVTPTATTTYTLTAANAAGSVTKPVTVTVATTTGPSIDTFTASAYQLEAGQPLTLTWTTTQMGSLWLSANAGGDPGSVAPNASIVLYPQTTTRYAIAGWNGQTNSMISKALTVNVGPPPAPTIASFTAQPASIALGASTTLDWSVTDADAITISANVGTSPGAVTGDSLTVSPTQTTTYTLTATRGTVTATRTAVVTVTGPAAPAIAAFYAQPAFITSGASTTLQWSVSGAQSVSISPGLGAVSGTSVTVSPTQTTTYTLSATNEIGTTTRTAVVTLYTPGGGGVSHPRIWLTPASLGTLRQRATQNDAAWIRLRNQADHLVTLPILYPDQAPASNTINGGYQYISYLEPATALSLAYQVARTVDPTRAAAYAAKARELLLKLSDPVRHGNPLIDSGYSIRAYVPALAIGYDWLYETLSASDRAQIFTEINRWVAAFDTGGFGRSFPNGNYFAGYYCAKALGALATEGDNPEAAVMWSDWLNRIHYGMVQPYYAQWLSGGGAPDGWNYGPFETINMVRPIAAAFTAKGLDLVHDTAKPFAYPDGHARWMTHFTWPDLSTVNDRGMLYGGNNPTAATAEWATHYAGLLRLANGDNAPIAQQFALELCARSNERGEPWADFMFHDPAAPAADYRTALSLRTPGDGQVAMRSSWSNDAVWGAFQAGPYTGYQDSAEEYYDKGSLVIQRGSVSFVVNATGALLRNTPGTSDGEGSPIWTLVYNDVLGTASDGIYRGRRLFNIFNAQRGTSYWGQGNAYPWQTNTTLSRFEEGTAYVLMRGANLESMYWTGSPISAWTRSVVYLRPQLFFVHDRTSVSNVAADHWMSWHVAAAPSEKPAAAGTRRFDVVDTRPAFGGNLFRGRVTTVLPAGHQVNTIDLFDRQKVYRLEVRPAAGGATPHATWLAVFDASANSVAAGNAQPLTAAAGTVHAGEVEGALVTNAGGNYAALFSRNGQPVTGAVSFSVPVGATSAVMADLQPGAAYGVTAALQGGTLTVTVAAGGSLQATAQGTLSFAVTAAGVVTTL